MGNRRPLLNSKAFITLRTDIDVRASEIIKAGSAIDAFGVLQYEEGDMSPFDAIVLDTDRVSFEGIGTFIKEVKLETGKNLKESDELNLTGSIKHEGELTGIHTLIRGETVSVATALEIPADRSYTRQDVFDAFADETISSVTRPKNSNRYVIEPTISNEFTLYSAPAPPNHEDALRELDTQDDVAEEALQAQAIYSVTVENLTGGSILD